MSKLRGLSRRMSKGKKRVSLKMEKHLRVKNGYVKITFPLTEEQFKILDLFTDYMMSFVYGHRSMDNAQDAQEWEKNVKLYIDALFGINSYYKCFGDDVATHEDIGNLFEQFNQIIAECKRELRN